MTEEDLSNFTEEQAEVIAANYDEGFNRGRRYQQELIKKWLKEHCHFTLDGGTTKRPPPEVMAMSCEDWDAFVNLEIK